MKICWLLPCMLVTATAVPAHVNDRGMDYEHFKNGYGLRCCGPTDCRPAIDFVETIIDEKPVVRLLLDFGWITVPAYFVVPEPATDGRAHFCGELYVPGNDLHEMNANPMCVILPPRNT
jgi:hypothetical protein